MDVDKRSPLETKNPKRLTMTSEDVESYVARRQQLKKEKFNAFLESVNRRCSELEAESGATPQRKPAVVKKYEPRLSGWAPSPKWKSHNRQKDAIDLVEKENERDVIVVAYEREQFGSNGQRRFVTCSAEELFFYYFQIAQSQRHHYEVICQRSKCKLYFDIEFNTEVNPNHNGPELVTLFIQLVNEFLAKLGFNRAKIEDILNLDSSTNEKFSRHLIFTRTVFRNNEGIATFVNELCRFIKARIDVAESMDSVDDCSFVCPMDESRKQPGFSNLSNSKSVDNASNSPTKFGNHFQLGDLRKLLVTSEPGKKPNDLFVDLSVYSKNRNFRMYKSSKLGKNVFLNRSKQCHYVVELRKADLEFGKQLKGSNRQLLDINPELHRTFLDSLITNIDFEPMEIVSADVFGASSSNSERTFKNCTPVLMNGLDPERTVPDLGIVACSAGYYMYAELESFIAKTLRERLKYLNITTRGDVYFRTCKQIAESSLVVYEVGHTYRYCERIGRFHKSNKVYICVDLEKCVFYQKCFDPDCQGFRGNEFTFPEQLIPWHGFESDLLDEKWE